MFNIYPTYPSYISIIHIYHTYLLLIESIYEHISLCCHPGRASTAVMYMAVFPALLTIDGSKNQGGCIIRVFVPKWNDVCALFIDNGTLTN